MRHGNKCPNKWINKENAYFEKIVACCHSKCISNKISSISGKHSYTKHISGALVLHKAAAAKKSTFLTKRTAHTLSDPSPHKRQMHCIYFNRSKRSMEIKEEFIPYAFVLIVLISTCWRMTNDGIRRLERHRCTHFLSHNFRTHLLIFFYVRMKINKNVWIWSRTNILDKRFAPLSQLLQQLLHNWFTISF